MRVEVGTRIYNHGDRANPSHFGTVTRIRANKWGVNAEIKPDADAECKPYWVPACMFSEQFQGHSGTRLVTEAAYLAWRDSQIAALGK